MKREKDRTGSKNTIIKLRGFAMLAVISSLLTLVTEDGVTRSRIGPPVPDQSCGVPVSLLIGPNDIVTVAITKLVEFGGTNIDNNNSGGDFYARVTINGGENSSFNERIEGRDFCPDSFPLPFPIPCVDLPYDFPVSEYGPNQLWQFSRVLLLKAGEPRSPVNIRIEIWDDDPGRNRDDLADLNPSPRDRALNLVFDPNTGQVSGDVNSPQGCSSGLVPQHLKPRNSFPVEMCFEISTLPDSDGDGLLDDWETCGFDPDGSGPMPKIDLPSLGANPMHKDLFVELDWMTGQEPTRDVIQALKAAFAVAPIDAGTRASDLPGGHSAKPNPDGRPGINLWVDTGNLRDAGGNLVGDNLGGGNAIDTASDPPPEICLPGDGDKFKNMREAHFNPGRSFIFRYSISSRLCTNEDGAGPGTCSDKVDNGMDGNTDFEEPECENRSWAEVGGNDFLLRGTSGSPNVVMHEFGHSLNLQHGGDEGNHCKPNYVSAMNYNVGNLSGIQQYQQSKIKFLIDFSPPRFGIEGGAGLGSCADGMDNDNDGVIDAADPDCLKRGVAPLPTLKEDALDESTILDPTDPVNWFVFSNGRAQIAYWPLNGDRDQDGKPDGVDWNGNTRPPLVEDGAGPGTCMDGMDNGGGDGIDAGDPDCRHDPPPTEVNIDNVRTIPDCRNRSTDSELTGFDDWVHISIPFRQFRSSANGVVNPPPPDQEPTFEELIETAQILNTTDLAITKLFRVQDLTYILTVVNKGPNPAGRVEVVDVLPPEVSHKSNTAGCVEVPAGTLTCDLGALLVGQERQIEIRVGISVRDDGSVPASITNTATVKNIVEFAGLDPEPIDNFTSITTTIPIVNGPTANADSYSTLQGTPLTVNAPGVLGNDISAAGRPLTAVLVSNPSNGTLTLNADGSITYTPNANFSGADSFTYKANDGTADSNVVTVSLTTALPPVVEQEPSLTEILTTLGFTNIEERPRRQTFPAGTYELQLLAEFSAFHEANIVSRYPVGTSQFQVLISGPVRSFGFTNPPISTHFTASARFGLALDTPTGQRFFTQNRRNINGAQQVRIFRDRNDPGSFLIGFEDLPGDFTDMDFQDVVLRLRRVAQ